MQLIRKVRVLNYSTFIEKKDLRDQIGYKNLLNLLFISQENGYIEKLKTFFWSPLTINHEPDDRVNNAKDEPFIWCPPLFSSKIPISSSAPCPLRLHYIGSVGSQALR